MNAPIMVLLVSLDAPFRKALLRECLAVAGDATCVESDDGMGAMLAPALDSMDLVLLDGALVKRHGPAWLTNWRRMVPRGVVLVLDAQGEQNFVRARQAVRHAVERGARAGS